MKYFLAFYYYNLVPAVALLTIPILDFRGSARVVQRQRLADAAVVAPNLSAPNIVVAREPVR